MKLISPWEAAADLKSRKLFSATAVILVSSLATDEKRAVASYYRGVHLQGHPQCRKKLITVGSHPWQAGSAVLKTVLVHQLQAHQLWEGGRETTKKLALA